MVSHPSYLQLDLLALGDASPEVAAHAEACGACGAHLGRLAVPVAVPRELPRPKSRKWLWSLLALSLSSAAAVTVVVLPRRHPEVTAKGSPSVAVYLRRGGQVSLWDGVHPLQAGDAVQLKVQSFGYSRITVGAVESKQVQTLYEGEAQPGTATLLPQAFTLDGSGGDALLVVFSRAPLSPEDLRAARESLRRDEELWTTVLDLTKKDSR
ncbi:MAG TPA: hypothetical protein VH083_04685 [Myxococcales bacterium]|nr:hypothetical protein [Myxococcales bacterium]